LRRIGLCLIVLLASGWCVAPAVAQVEKSLLNEEGVEAPCLGIGVGMALVSKCVKMAEEQGFIRVNEVGYSGLTVGTTGDDDGKVTAVAPGSPAATAGFALGDMVVAVNGKAAKRTPGTIAYSEIFGGKGQEVVLKTKRAGAETEIKLVRAQAPAPANAPKGSMLLMVHPLVDWHGQFIPCMGAGPAAALSFSYCNKKFEPHGYVKTSELGTTGIQLDMERKDAAMVTAVDSGSPAATAGVQAGDEIIEVGGKPLTASVGENANEEMFAKVGATVQVTVHRGSADKTIAVTLAANPKDAKQ
jgi:C-terminal processing protease CtpA/Prc